MRAIFVVFFLLASLGSSAGLAAPQTGIDALNKQRVDLAKAIEKLNDANKELDYYQSKINASRIRLNKADRLLKVSLENLDTRVVELYKQDIFLPVFFLFDSDDIHEFTYYLFALERSSERDAKLISSLQDAQAELEKEVASIEESLKSQRAIVSRMTETKRSIEREVTAKEAALLPRINNPSVEATIPTTGVIFEKGWASWYDLIRGNTAAHKTLPKGTYVRVTNLVNGKQVTVKIIDRGPYIKGRVIDLSKTAFAQIFPTSRGLCYVSLENLGKARPN